MNKIVIIALLATLNAHAIKLDKDTVQLAKCNGVMIGNSYLDYVGEKITKKEFENVIMFSSSLYMKKIYEKSYTKDEVLKYDSISAGAMNQLILAADNENFDEEEYEEVIACYQKYGIEFMQKANWDPKLELLIEKVAKDAMHNIDALLDK
jgi:hypothetical protein